MRIITSPTYRDVFSDDIPNLEELLSDLPSSTVIDYLCAINSKLFLSSGPSVQIEIFELLSIDLSKERKKNFLINIGRILKDNKKDDIQFFSIQASLEFLHYELVNFRELPRIMQLDTKQELKFLKAYFVIIERINDNYKSVFNLPKNKEDDFFFRISWPTFIEQLEINHSTNPLNNLIKSLIFFNYFEKNDKYQDNVETFLNYHDKNNYWEYCKFLMDILKSNWEKDEENSTYGKFLVPNISEINTLLNNFTIDQKKYKEQYSENKKNYTGLKDKPLMKLDKDFYNVINWNFINNKFYEGLIFDFYKHSNINSKSKFKTFPDFKNFVANEITERFLFRKILKYLLNDKYSKLEFDNDKEDGFPDAYYRKGKYIYIFEIKDAYFPSASIDSYNYERIKESIDQKYNSNKKGTAQLINSIKYLSKKPFEQKSYLDLKLKQRNLIIYPIMIYTDRIFSMPGINKYLNIEFRKKLSHENLQKEFQKVNDIAFINISFLLYKVHTIKNFKFSEIIDQYFNEINKAEKNFNNGRNEQDMFDMNMNFEEFIDNSKKLEKVNPDYVKKTFEIFEMRKHFA